LPWQPPITSLLENGRFSGSANIVQEGEFLDQ